MRMIKVSAERLVITGKFSFKKYLACLLFTFAMVSPVAAYDQPWNGFREDITGPAPEPTPPCPSGNCSCDGTGSPVYIADGSLVWRDLDVNLNVNTKLQLQRTYNSFDYRAGLFGRGWVTAQESNIARTYKAIDDGNADGSPSKATNFGSVPIWLASYGRRYVLQESATQCTTPSVLYFTFEKQADGSFKQVYEDNNDYSVYDKNGVLIQSYSDKDGASIYYEYDLSGRLAGQYDSDGARLQFIYNDQGFVSQVIDQSSRAWEYSYDIHGRLESVLDPDGNTRSYGYQVVDNTGYKQHLLNNIVDNGNDPVLSVVWADRTIGSSTQIRVIGYTDADGRVHNYTYSATTYNGAPAVKVNKETKWDGSGTSVESKTYIADANTYHILNIQNNKKGLTTSVVYDSRGKYTEVNDNRNNITKYEYNQYGRIIKIIELFGTVNQKETSIAYWDNTDRIAIKNEYGLRETRYTYDGYLRVLTKTLVDLSSNQQRVTIYTYHQNTTDDQGNLVLGKVATIDGSQIGGQDTVSLSYDSSRRVSQLNLPLNQSILFSYNNAGNIASITDLNGIPTVFSYDSNNNLIESARNGRIKKWAYNKQNQIMQFTDELSRTIKYSYNDHNKLSKVTFHSGDYQNIAYNYGVNQTEIVLSEYDSSDTLVRTRVMHQELDSELPKKLFLSNIQDQVVQWNYNALNDLESEINYGQYDSNAPSTTLYNYDAQGRLVRMVDALTGITQLQYNALGYLTDVKDPNNATTSYTNTAWGELLGYSSPDKGVTSYQINESGKISSETNANNQQAVYRYDASNRILQLDYNGTNLDVNLVYDEGVNGIGRLTSLTDGSGSTQILYEERGLISQVNSIVAGTTLNTRYLYNDASEITDVVYPSGLGVKYSYDASGNISSISMTENSLTTDILSGLDWTGNRLNTATYGNGLVEESQYDNAGRLVGKNYGGLGEQFTNSLDNTGNVLQQNLLINNVQTINAYQYDALSRVIQDNNSHLNQNYTFAYDLVGNRKVKQELNASSSESYTYQTTSNRLTQVGVQPIQRDNAGNLINDGVRIYQYNAMNRISQIDHTVYGTQSIYSYNYLGQRVRKLVTGTQTSDVLYVYGQKGQLLGEYDVTGNRIREYVYMVNNANHLVAQIESDGAITYINTDHLGTPRLATRQDKTVVWRWISTIFGDTQPTGNVEINHRFPGQYFDSESGLHYNYFRYYNPETGRYITSDPIGLRGGLNTFTYALNNPHYWYDPFGLTVSCTYNQSTGQLTCTDDNSGQQTVNEQCYSGAPGAVNDPSQQNTPNVGPIPTGDYDIGAGVGNRGTGPQSLPLNPTPNNNQFPTTRDPNSFLMHGDNSQGNQSASQGCIICSRGTRDTINNSGGGTITVQ